MSLRQMLGRIASASVFSATVLFTGAVGTVAAQAGAPRRVEVTPYFGYQAGGGVTSFSGQLAIEGALNYGILVDVRVRPDATIQVLYDRQDTILDFHDNNAFFPRRVRADLAVEYYHLGGTVEFGEKRLRPYFGLTVGATRFIPKVEGFSDEWRFSIGVGLGFKTYLSDRFALRVDGRVWPTFLSTSGGLFCSLPGACLVSVEGDFITQANATAGFSVLF